MAIEQQEIAYLLSFCEASVEDFQKMHSVFGIESREYDSISTELFKSHIDVLADITTSI